MSQTKILILGVTGMLGHVLFKKLSLNPSFVVTGTCRTPHIHTWFSEDERKRIRYRGGNVDAENFDSIIRAIASAKPDVVINCIGIIKQDVWSKDPLASITVNALFPHRVSMLCATAGARLIHISTDCVFDGSKGNYTEEDPSDAKDLYGRTKFLGEVAYDHCITLRTSIIGHELRGHRGLIDWFLAQSGEVKGYSQAIFSGFPTVEISDIIENTIIPNPSLKGMYHLSTDPISKYDLLNLVAKVYGKKITIRKFDDFVLDRSMDSSRFRSESGYIPPSWPELIRKMFQFTLEHTELYDKLLKQELEKIVDRR